MKVGVLVSMSNGKVVILSMVGFFLVWIVIVLLLVDFVGVLIWNWMRWRVFC